MGVNINEFFASGTGDFIRDQVMEQKRSRAENYAGWYYYDISSQRDE